MIYKCKIEGRGPKNFSNHQNAIDLFINLRDGNVNRKEVLKNQTDYKSDLGKKKRNPKLKSEDQINVIKNFQFIFYLRERIIDFYRDYSIFLSEVKCKVKHGKGSQNINPLTNASNITSSTCTSKSR